MLLSPSQMLVEANNAFGTYLIPFTDTVNRYGENYFYCILEGKNDVFYYKPRIEIQTQKSSVEIVCNSKHKVVELYNYIKSKDIYNKYLIGYFVDHDYDRKKLSKDIYTTEGYSIENFYCSKEAIKKILNMHFQIKDNEEIFDIICNFESHEFDIFSDIVIDFLAWYIILQRKGYKSKNFNFDYIFEKYIHIEINNIKRNTTFRKIKKEFQDAPAISMHTLSRVKNLLRKNTRGTIRGKFCIVYLLAFIKFLKEQWNKKEGKFYQYSKGRKVTTLDITEESIYSSLSINADTPRGLQNYLSAIIQKKQLTK